MNASSGNRPRYNERLKFSEDDTFYREVRRRVDEHFRKTSDRKRDCPRMYLKTAIILAAFALTWTSLVFFASTWWQALPLAVVLGLCVAAIGFNIEHDGGHNAFSSRQWVNRITAMTMDLVGASSYVWRWKHAIQHHTHTNIKGYDADIELGAFGRLTPDTKHRWYFRWQHLYLWPLYGLLVMKWHVYDDFQNVLIGKIGDRPFPRPRGWSLFSLLAGKVVCFSVFLFIPLLFHPVWLVLGMYFLVFSIVGVLLAVVFQLAHCVELATFKTPDPDSGGIATSWAVHQIQSTVNFSRESRVVTWFLGGLNYQIEHHLFPSICHTNYPAISNIVRDACREFSIRYNEFPTMFAGIASHYRWLKRVGQPQVS